MRNRFRPAAGLVAGTLFLAGCGGNPAPAPPRPPAGPSAADPNRVTLHVEGMV